jgi:hypothetical protein
MFVTSGYALGRGKAPVEFFDGDLLDARRPSIGCERTDNGSHSMAVNNVA